MLIVLACNGINDDRTIKNDNNIDSSIIINLINDSLNFKEKPIVLVCDSSEQKLMNTMLQFTYDEFNQIGDTSYQFSMIKKIKNSKLICSDSHFLFQNEKFISKKEGFNFETYQSIVISDLIFNKKKNYACFYFALHDNNDSQGFIVFIKKESVEWKLFWLRKIWK